MKVTFTEAIDATLVVSARLGADGQFGAYVAAHCPYAEGELDGAMCSAQVEFPPEIADQVKAAFEKAREQVSQALGRELSKSKAVAYKESVRQGEIGR